MKSLMRVLILLLLSQHILSEKCEEITDETKCDSAEDKSETQTCIKNIDSSNPVCKLEYLCSSKSKTEQMSANDNCNLFVASNPSKFGCAINPESTSVCAELPLCGTGENINDEKCRDYPVSFENRKSSICVKKSGGGCEEKKILCTEVPDDITFEYCNFYQTSDDTTYKCTINLDENRNSPCKEEEKYCGDGAPLGGKTCSDFKISKDMVCLPNDNATEAKTEPCIKKYRCEWGLHRFECPLNYVEDPTKYICVNNTEDISPNCVLKKKSCAFVEAKEGEELTDSICNEHPVSPENNNTHICVKDPKNNKCIEQLNGAQNTSETSLVTTKLTNETTIPNGEYGEYTIKSTFINTIKNTYNTYNIQTTSITSTNITSPNESVEISLIFLGCSQFKPQNDNLFTFTIHFIPVKYSIPPPILIFPLNIIYNTYLRGLEEFNANCDLEQADTFNYKCEVQASTNNIKQITFEPNFNFGSQNNIKISGISPLAKNAMNNLMDNKYDQILLSNPTIYILDNSILDKYETYKFYINGIIEGNKPKSVTIDKDLVLMVNIESDNENSTKDLNCKVINIINNNNYTLNCETNEDLKYNLQSAISILDDGLLITNFDNINNNNNNPFIEPEANNNIKYHSNKSSGISAGAIVGIILACVVVIAIVTGIIIYIRKGKKAMNNNDSNVVQLKNN